MVKSTLERESKVPEAVVGPVGNQSLLIHVYCTSWCGDVPPSKVTSWSNPVGKEVLCGCMVLSECI